MDYLKWKKLKKKLPSSSSGVGYCDRCTIIFIWSNIQIKNKEIDF